MVVEGVLFYNIWRFRRAPAGRTDRAAAVLRQQADRDRLDRGACLIVFTIGLVTTRTLWEVAPDPPEPQPDDHALCLSRSSASSGGGSIATNITTGGRSAFTTANELHIPASDAGIARPVYLDAGVGRRLPQLLGAAAGRQDRPDSGPYESHVVSDRRDRDCSSGNVPEYCGTQHANMLIRVVVDSPGRFRALAGTLKRSRPSTMPAAETGRAAFLAQSCVNCHRVRGTPAQGTYAPDLTHLMSRANAGLRAWCRTTPENLRPLDRESAASQAGLPDAGVWPGLARATRRSSTTCESLALTINCSTAMATAERPLAEQPAALERPAVPLDRRAARLGDDRSITSRSASCTS